MLCNIVVPFLCLVHVSFIRKSISFSQTSPLGCPRIPQGAGSGLREGHPRLGAGYNFSQAREPRRLMNFTIVSRDSCFRRSCRRSQVKLMELSMITTKTAFNTASCQAGSADPVAELSGPVIATEAGVNSSSCNSGSRM